MNRTTVASHLEHAYPAAAHLYADLRRLREQWPTRTLVVLSGSGRIDPHHPALAEQTLVLTSEQGAARLVDRLPHSATIVPIGGEPTLRRTGSHLFLRYELPRPGRVSA